ncbi:MAG TPA: hypothetical protein VFX86_00340 [Candidatus Saccharimonadales bacterium]|nr:hypothetical protein [Candidatus Saccharimonadales bacterium]
MTFWQKQSRDEPIFPDLIWSRPENRRHAGKLLIIGGQAGEFALVAKAFEAANRAGAGTTRVILPQSLSKVAQTIPEVELAPANKSGSFARNSLAAWFDASDWADHVLLAGDFGKNSETTTIIDGFLLRGNSPVTLSLGTLPSTGIGLAELVKKPMTLIIDRGILQKLGTALGLSVPVKSTTPAEGVAEIIHQISLGNQANLIIHDEKLIWTAVAGDIISTSARPVDNTALSAVCAVWLMQNPNKPLEALATACFEAANR